jgi:UDP-N-acetylmuramate: L-alanyl-gamma-D-glutamyl-meso-diaminopimelate ligase
VRIHFIGVCGTAMGTLAAMLQRRGHHVTGSDAGMYPPMSDFLAREGVVTSDGFDAAHISNDLEMVVVGNAVSRGNVELEAVLDRRVRYQSLPECLRDHWLWDRRPVVVTGTHGKTTTTALTGWVLTHGGLDPTIFVGGIAVNLDGSYRVGEGADVVVEGDEYDSAFFDKTAKFLKYVPDIAVINNIEFDHADIYRDLDEILLAFRRLIRLIPSTGRLIANGDDPNVAPLLAAAPCPVETIGIRDAAGVSAGTAAGAGLTWAADRLEAGQDGMRFDVVHREVRLGRAMLPMAGAHNVRNALVALAVGHARGLTFDRMCEALREFRGVKRRLEARGTVGGVTVLDDFAHHPTAIAQTLAGVRQSQPSARIWAIFEPRSASSCRRVFQEAFADAFDVADEVVIASVYRSSLPEPERLSVDELVATLQARGRRARHVATAAEIAGLVAAEARPGDLVLVMSNGGFDDIHDRLLKALLERARVDDPDHVSG